MESARIFRPAHAALIDAAPITRRHGEPVELAIGDQVIVHFDDGLGLEGAHQLEGEIVQIFNHNRVAVLVGKLKFSVPAEACELAGRAE